MEILQDQLVTIFGTVLTMIAGYGVKQLKGYLDKKGISQKLKVYESSARIAVSAVEQIYRNEDGPEKFKRAKEHMAKSLQQQGLNISESDLQYWIESAVYGIQTGVKAETIHIKENPFDTVNIVSYEETPKD